MSLESEVYDLRSNVSSLTEAVEKVGRATNRAALQPSERICLDEMCVEAVKEGRADDVKWLLEAGASLICWKREGFSTNVTMGRTLFSMACEAGHLEVVSVLDNLNAMDKRRASNGMTPMEYADKNGHVEVVEYLKSREPYVSTRGW